MKTTLATLTLIAAVYTFPLFAIEATKPVEITADATAMVGGVAVATGGAKLTSGGVTVVADKIEYDADKRIARLFVSNPEKSFTLRAVINLEPHQ